jgi:hypothetical protein
LLRRDLADLAEFDIERGGEAERVRARLGRRGGGEVVGAVARGVGRAGVEDPADGGQDARPDDSDREYGETAVKHDASSDVGDGAPGADVTSSMTCGRRNC